MQELISQHYTNTRKLWGTEYATDKQAEAYKGLGNLYLTDERFVLAGDKYDTKFAAFIKAAMTHYADQHLSWYLAWQVIKKLFGNNFTVFYLINT